MSVVVFLLACIAGGFGAGLRYLVDVGVMAITRGRFPWGIIVVNITGSFALGVVTASLPEAVFIVGAGLLGGYTTFSTSALDAVALWRDGERPASVLQIGVTLVASVIAAFAGLALGGLL
ncbi:CrcB family protein [uncultured Microbacterium sp.]|uniref:fluoride efflux transporter FluC n=1 Tax=uncultured Microbacterium sp. TaxID=191216 RepID=UPI0026317118|nr:CrcB family protein [uncultured Microbacterium sp.]